jgi:cytoskeleton protein RodZ
MTTSQNSDQGTVPPEYHTDLPVGEILRRTRVHYNQSIEDVANFMRIRVTQLEAIEKGDIDQLPGRVYAIGYVRTYSEYLGLDGEKMIQLFKQQSGSKSQKPELHFPVAASESKAPNISLILVSLAVLVLVIGMWMVISASGGREPDAIAEIPNVPSDMRVADVMGTGDAAKPAAAPAVVVAADGTVLEDMSLPAGATPPQPAATAPSAVDGVIPPAVTTDAAATTDANAAAVAAVAAAGTDAAVAAEATTPAVPAAVVPPAREIVINVKQRAWVEVRDKQNKAILSRIIKPGESFVVPEENYGLRLDTGNAGGLEFSVNGQVLRPLGAVGDILRGIVLDGAPMLEKYPPLPAGTAAAVAATPAPAAETPAAEPTTAN